MVSPHAATPHPRSSRLKLPESANTQPPLDARASRPDWIYGRWHQWTVSLLRSNNLRDLRDLLLRMAFHLSADLESDEQAMCVLVGTKITDKRVYQEMESLQRVLRSKVRQRVHVLMVDPARGLVFETRTNPGPGFTTWLTTLIGTDAKRSAPVGATKHAVLAMLLRQWFSKAAPQTTAAIQQAVGASYPTVAAVLKDLERQDQLARTSDRRVSLTGFPWDSWARWVQANHDAVKKVAFVDPTGRARSPRDMVKRLAKLGRADVAVGGVLGAEHHFPEINITGTPRLDLTVRARRHAVDLDWVKRLDASLVPAGDRMAQARVVVHFVDDTGSFSTSPSGESWADPLQCLLDLHTLKLDAQADQMLRALIKARNRG
jgi:hypothetical protein